VSLIPDSQVKIKEINIDYFYNKFIRSVNKNSKVRHGLLDDGCEMKVRKINQDYFICNRSPLEEKNEASFKQKQVEHFNFKKI
jgi:hypothetical protein